MGHRVRKPWRARTEGVGRKSQNGLPLQGETLGPGRERGAPAGPGLSERRTQGRAAVRAPLPRALTHMDSWQVMGRV